MRQHIHGRYPSKKDKTKFEQYSQEVDKKLVVEKLKDQPVVDEQSFVHQYQALTRIIVNTVEEVFRLARRVEWRDTTISNPLIRQLKKKLRHIGGALYLERKGRNALVSDESRQEYEGIRNIDKLDTDTNHRSGNSSWTGEKQSSKNSTMPLCKRSYQEQRHAIGGGCG